MSHPPRQSVRVRLHAEVRLRRAVDRPHEVKLRDLSTHGCSVDLVNRVQAGDRLWVKLPGLESIEGFVCWAEEFHAGIVFLTPLHPAVFDMLQQKHGH